MYLPVGVTTPPAGPNCILSVADIQNQESIQVYPNPSNGLVTIAYSNYAGKMSIQLVDLNGRIVYNDLDSSFNGSKEINIANLNAGVYILKIDTEEASFTRKIIKK